MEKFFWQRKQQEPDFQIPGLVFDLIRPVSDVLEDGTFGIVTMPVASYQCSSIYPQ